MKNLKFLAVVAIAVSMVACKSTPQPVSMDDPKLKAMIDSIVRVRVEKYVQVVLSQRPTSSVPYDYRKVAREEAEKEVGRAAQYRQRQEDNMANSQY